VKLLVKLGSTLPVSPDTRGRPFHVPGSRARARNRRTADNLMLGYPEAEALL